jgi:RNA polymerase sigma-70 factor, ECF subfamily
LETSVSPSTPSEDALVSRLRAGDGAAFEEIVHTYGGRMLKVARRLLRSPEEAQDAVQDAFISAFRAIDGFDQGSKIYTWLHRIVVNSSLKRLRTLRRDTDEAIEPFLPRFKENGARMHPPVEWTRSFDAALERRETRALVRASIDRLPVSYRTVLILRDIEEFDTEEAASLLGVSENAVKIRLHRARLALRDLLEPHICGRTP